MPDNKTEQPGRFEHYRVMTDADGKPVKLGEGAMGVTYLAEDTNLRVKVALKVIAPNLLGDTEIVQRFQREAQAAARLRHPNVAAVYHLGEVDDTFFYTMEFVEGRTLREHVAENGPLGVKQALEVTLQMCEALGAAERHQMVHRDIKPANIMLETTEDGLHAKLIDFGLAKPLQHDAQQTSALLTQRGTFLGTAVFASPEQVQDLPLDTRSDFYALGLTFWVMLEGRPPFEGSLHKVLYDQVHTKPPMDRLMWVPAEVRSLIDKLLEKEPGSRPQTARELRQMIHDCLRVLGGTGTGQADWQRRFQVRQTVSKPQPWGTIYEGQDSLSGDVWLHFLRSDRFSDPDAMKRVIAGVRRAIEIHHPNVLRHLTVFPAHDPQGAAGWMVVTEHPGAHTLLGHLRQVKQMSVEEGMPLIERLGEALDCCLANDLNAADLDAGRIYLKQTSVGDSGPVEVVPKLIPLDYQFPATLRTGSADDSSFGVTQIMPRTEARNATDAVQRLAMLAYQCFGGSWGHMRRYIPLPGLSQHQNETLREALGGKKYTHAADLIEALRQHKTRKPATAAPTLSDATVTLSPWERLAALASPDGTQAPSEVAAKSQTPSAEAQPAAASESASAPAMEHEGAHVAEASGHSSAPAEEVAAPPDAPAEWPTASEPEEPAPAVAPAAEKSAALRSAARPAPAESSRAATEPPAQQTSTSSATSTSSGSQVAVRHNVTELPVSGQPATSTKTSPIAALRKTMEREWRDAKPIIDRVATPVRQTVSTIPRWVFISLGCFIVAIGVVLWAIANRPMPVIPANPGDNPSGVVQQPTGDGAKQGTPTSPASLDQLLQTGTDLAARGNSAELLPVWREMEKNFPEPRWTSLARSAEFIDTVTKAYLADQLGDPAQAAHDYAGVLAQAAKKNDLTLLNKLSVDLKADAAAAERFELALLNLLVEDRSKSELLLDESLRLIQTRQTGPVAERAHDIIQQTLEVLVTFRERWKRPEDINSALQIAIKDLGPKLEALASTEEPSALYLYADKLRSEGRLEDSMKYFEKAAQLEHVPSMLQLALVLSNSKKKDFRKAADWLKQADSKGYPQATFVLGESYLDGKGVERDYGLALAKLEAAAAQGIAEAHYTLGDAYHGNVPADSSGGYDPTKLNPGLKGEARLQKAREHFESALKSGADAAKGPLASMLMVGQGGPRDLARGAQLLDEVSKTEKPDPAVLRNYAYVLMPDDMRDVAMPFTQEELAKAKIKTDAQRAEQLMRQAARGNDAAAIRWCQARGVLR